MTDQKAENVLNLAVATPEAERQRTEDLNVGYDATERTWEIIVKYHGDLRNFFARQHTKRNYKP